MKFIKIVSREYSVQYTEMSLRSLRQEAKKHLPALVLSQFYVPEDKNESCYVDEKEWQYFITALDKKYSATKNLNKFVDLFHYYGRNYVAVAKKIGGFNLVKASNENLAENYKNYQKALLEYSAYVWMSFLLNNIYAEKANSILSNKKLINAEKISASLFSPAKRSGILKLQDRIFELKNEKSDLSEQEIGRLLEEYKWISCLDIHNDPWNKKDLRGFIKNLKDASVIYSFKKAAALVGLNKKEIEYFMLARELAYVKDMRDEYRRKGIYRIQSFFTEMAKRLGVSRKELAYFFEEEILKVLRDERELSRAEATKRQNGFLICYDKKIQVISDKVSIKKFVHDRIDKKVTGKRQIKGIVASSGKAKGTAKIVLGVSDLVKVQKGDIMIAVTTHPDFVSAMHQSQAIVTDEGGFTSHAAIVARELGIPCIVGTKIATKVFKDGDMVEVDAEKGVIRILNNLKQ